LASSEQTVEAFLAALAARTPAPGGGGAAAVACALAAALVEMVAAFTPGQGAAGERAAAARSLAVRLADEDAEGYARVIEAWGMPKDDPSRAERVTQALSDAADVPLALAAEAAVLAEAAAALAATGNPNLRGDAVAGAVLAEAAGVAAARLVEINLEARGGDPRGERARELVGRARSARRRALAA